MWFVIVVSFSSFLLARTASKVPDYPAVTTTRVRDFLHHVKEPLWRRLRKRDPCQSVLPTEGSLLVPFLATVSAPAPSLLPSMSRKYWMMFCIAVLPSHVALKADEFAEKFLIVGFHSLEAGDRLVVASGEAIDLSPKGVKYAGVFNGRIATTRGEGY